MSRESEFIQSELPEIARIIRNECWFEGERRGTPVDAKDPTIQTRVADIILNGVGQQLREERGGAGS